MVRVGVLGPLAVSGSGGRPVKIGGYRVRALLILLALDAGRAVPAHALIERLWQGDRPADAGNALQSLVSRLRQALRQGGLPDSLLEFSPAGYRLNIAPYAVDALAFEDQVKRGSRALADGDARRAADTLAAALDAWRGSALADVAHEEFAFAAAARLDELRTAAILDRIEAELALGDAGTAAVSQLRETTAADPLGERPAALLMRALAAAGRQSEALAVYQDVKDALADSLGVDPSPQLQQAHLAVLRQEIPLKRAGETAAAQPRKPRRPPTSFVGRDEDVATVLKRLKSGRLITLTGPGGVGKTRLATEAAAQLAQPVWLAELAPVTDPAEVPFVVLDALGLRERSITARAADRSGDPADTLCAALADRDAVLILDNCEHVVDAAAALAARVVGECPQVRVLATSREPLRIGGEALHVVAPLAARQAVRLFADRAAAVLPDFDPAADAEVVGRICRTLDGMPLAIELAVPWLRTLPPAQLAARLADRFAILTGGSRTALPRHQTLRAVVEWSWDLLTERQRVLSRRLAVFPAGATLDAAERACASEPLGVGEVLPTLAELVAKSILTRVDAEGEGEPRYRMLDTVRAYARERLAEAGEEESARDAAARYYLDFAEEADPQLRAKEQGRWFRALSDEQDNVNAAIRWSVARGDVAAGLRFMRSLGYYWVQCGRGDADVLSREVLAMPVPSPLTLPLAEGRVICALLAAGWNWDLDTVREPLLAALAELDELAPDREAVHPLVLMAEPVVLTYDGGAAQAQEQFARYVTARDPWLRAVGKVYVASYGVSVGNLDGAEQMCRDGLAEMRALGERWGVAVALTQLAEFSEMRADHAASIEAITEAVTIGKELSVWGELSYVESRLAVLHGRAGDFDGAYAALVGVERSVEERGGQLPTDRWVQLARAELAAMHGDYAVAAQCCEAVLASATGQQARWWESLRAVVKALQAVCVLRLGDEQRAAALLAGAAEAAAGWWEHPSFATVLDGCAVYAVLRADGPDPEQSARLLGAAAALRGAFDESSLDAPFARAVARAALGEEAFQSAYAAGGTATYESALSLVRDLLPAQPR
jgi:predicted ATPase/DNA-binding winged helix-turn-helix (wHTH) protein